MLRRMALPDVADASVELLVPPPAAGRRRWIGLFIAGFLASQVLIPLSYYVGDEPTSERFAWRMFSTIHMSRWHCSVWETIRLDGKLTQRRLPLESMFEESTVAALHAGQLDYAKKLLGIRIRRPEVVRVDYSAEGRLPSGQRYERIHLVQTHDGLFERRDPGS